MTRTGRIRGAVAAAVLAVMLAGCLLLPGKFGSELSLRRDGTFSYSYKGEIYLMALADPEKAGAGEEGEALAPFEPESCYDEDTIEERPCTKDELAQQKADYDERQTQAAAKKEQDAKMMAAMMGGIDPSDPKAADEFAARLMKQEGWKSVVHRGDGRFEVEYAISGRLDHDFVFPTIEKMPGISPFVTVVRRSDGTVRVEAPGFTAGGASTPMTAFLQGMASSPGGGPTKKDNSLPKPEGTFAVVTDGEVLANDTDDGPVADPLGKRLEWKVDFQRTATPTALVRLHN